MDENMDYMPEEGYTQDHSKDDTNAYLPVPHVIPPCAGRMFKNKIPPAHISR